MNIVYAKSQVSFSLASGVIVTLDTNQPWDADDEAVAARPDFFSPTPVAVKTSAGWVTVETATAAPGELRKTR